MKRYSLINDKGVEIAKKNYIPRSWRYYERFYYHLIKDNHEDGLRPNLPIAVKTKTL